MPKQFEMHDSIRGAFSWYLYDEMAMNKDIWLVVGDLGYGMFNSHFQDFPDRCINTGAAETAMMDIACGLAMSGKIPVVYSITPFLLARPYESIRNYVDHECLNVKLIGSGRDDDYKHDGFSHDAGDAELILKSFPNIAEYWPNEKGEIQFVLSGMLANGKPSFLSLKR